MSIEAKTVEYRFDSKIYSGEDIKRKIEQIKRDFSRISNKLVEVRVELNELGIYVLTFKFYAKRNIAKIKPEKITKLYIESLGEYSDGYINKLIGNKESSYIKKLKSRDKEHKQLQKRLKEQSKKPRYARVEYVKEEKKKNQNKIEQIEEIKPKQYNNYNRNENNKKQESTKRTSQTPHIEYLHREEDNKKFTEKLNEYLQMLKNVKSPKLERKNKVNVKNKVEKKNDQYEQKSSKQTNYNYKSYKKTNKKEQTKQTIGEKHYWSENYIPKEYGKYKETKKFKPL